MRQGNSRRCKINEKGRKTNTNCVDGDTDGGKSVENEGKLSSTPEYIFSVGDEKKQTNGILTLQVGGVHLPNKLMSLLTWV